MTNQVPPLSKDTKLSGGPGGCATGAARPLPASPQENMFVVTATSMGYEAGSSSVITLNNVMVACQKSPSGHMRGLHVVVVDPKQRAILCGQVFDTYKDNHQMEAFIRMNI